MSGSYTQSPLFRGMTEEEIEETTESMTKEETATEEVMTEDREVKEKTDAKIKEWIDSQMEKRSCLVVLVGATTSGRKWINYEINKAYELNKGIVGIYIHGLKDANKKQTTKGSNPFYNILIGENKERLSKYVECYEPPYTKSTDVYDDIEENIEQLIEDAISNSGTY